jgi:ribosomal protein S8
MNKIILFLNLLKNASRINKNFIVIKYSKPVENLTCLLYNEGTIQSYYLKTINKDKFLIIFIRYYQNVSSLSTSKLLFKKKKKNYLKYSELLFLNEKKKTFFLSTKMGILTLLKCKHFKVGGCLLFSC